MHPSIVLSHYQTKPLERAWQARQREATTSLDLGLTTTTVQLDEEGIHLPDGTLLTWEQVATISATPNNVFRLEEGEPVKIQTFSTLTNRQYSLMPTKRAPTMLVSGIPMHRIKGTDPVADTRAKIRAVAPVKGMVLDTATGLGYTAIAAARTAEHVITIELDPAALEMARANPWSQALFTTPNIEQRIGDAFDVVETLEDETFHRIIHDPPAFSLAGHLYSTDFYRELYRILRPGGRLFHYIGDPNSKSGRNITRGVLQRLEQAGFRRTARRPNAFGVVAWK
nr:methyltransferase domain-containing protein [Ardenticatena sp.]